VSPIEHRDGIAPSLPSSAVNGSHAGRKAAFPALVARNEKSALMGRQPRPKSPIKDTISRPRVSHRRPASADFRGTQPVIRIGRAHATPLRAFKCTEIDREELLFTLAPADHGAMTGFPRLISRRAGTTLRDTLFTKRGKRNV
jgi:hypothetical protein